MNLNQTLSNYLMFIFVIRLSVSFIFKTKNQPMKKRMMAVVLLAYSAVNGQTMPDSAVRKRQFTFDVKDPLIHLAGRWSGSETLKLTYKQEINEGLRWTLSGSAIFPSRNYSNYLNDYSKGNKIYFRESGLNPEIQLNGGLEFTKSKGKFTRYLGAELYIKYQHARVDECSKYKVTNLSSPSGYSFSQSILEQRKTRESQGVGISLFYGYEYKLSRHWAINAEVRYDAGVTLSKYKTEIGDVQFNKSNTIFTGSMDGLISRIGINYLFYGKKK